MADADIKIKISKDPSSDLDKGLANTEAATTKLVDAITGGVGSEALGAFRNLAGVITGPVGIAIGGAIIAVGGFKKVIDFTIQAEKIDQIKNSFDNLAASANISGRMIEEGLIAASRGLADDTEILQAASRGIVAFEERANVLPEIMDLARKATRGFGGELVSNFETINNALSSGNARALRQYGIIVDSEAAQRRYAQSLGVSADVLSESGKRAAVLNAALEQMRAKFAGIDESSTPATDSVTQFKVSIGQLKDQIAKTFQSSGIVTSFFSNLKSEIDLYTGFLKDHFGSATEQAGAKLRNAKQDVANYTAEIARLNLMMEQASGIDKGLIQASIGQVTTKLLAAKNAVAEYSKSLDQLKPKENSGDFVKLSAGNGAQPQKSDVDQKALLALNQQVQASILSVRASKLAADQDLIRSTQDYATKSAQIEQLYAEKRRLIIDEYNKKELDLLALKNEGKAGNDEQYAQQATLIEEERIAKFKALWREEREARRQGQKDSESDAKDENDGKEITRDTLEEGFKQTGKKLTDTASQIATTVRSTLATGFVSAFSAIGNAFATGQNALEAFGKSVLSTLGDLCLYLGRMFFLAGIASEGLPFMGLSGGTAIAAGAALSVLGGVLKGIGGGGGDSSSASVGGSPSSSINTMPETEPAKPTTAVTVNVQGNILDRRETGLYIANTLNEYFGGSDGRLVVAS